MTHLISAINHSFENPSSLTHSFPFFDPQKLNSLETRAVEEKNVQSKINLTGYTVIIPINITNFLIKTCRVWISGFSVLIKRQGNIPWGSCPDIGLMPVGPQLSHPWDRCKGQWHKLWEMNENEAAVSVIFTNHSLLFVWAPLRVPELFSISRKKQSLMPLYISICFVVICSQLAKPDKHLNGDIFSRTCVILSLYYSPTNEAQGEMSSTYYHGHHNYQYVLCTYYVPGTMLSFYRIKGLNLIIRGWGRSENYPHFTFWYGETEAGQVSVIGYYFCIRLSGPRYLVIVRHELTN